LRAVAATSVRYNARRTLRSRLPIRRWSRGLSLPIDHLRISRIPFDLPPSPPLLLDPSLFSRPRSFFRAVTLSDFALSDRLCQCWVPADYVIQWGTGGRPGEKNREKDGRRGIAGFGKLNSRAGFTVSRETRIPGLD